MPTWPAYFVVIIAVAFALQTAILAAVYFQTKKSHEQVMRMCERFARAHRAGDFARGNAGRRNATANRHHGE